MKKVIPSLLIAGLMLACQNDDPGAGFPIKFSLTTFDSNGVPKSVFNEGDEIVLSFFLANTTDEDVYLDNFEPDLVCRSDSDFFRVYERRSFLSGWSDLGRPCIPSNCTLQGGFLVGAHSARQIDYSWPGNCGQNDKLPKGKFRTGFRYEFKVSAKNQKSKHQFSKEFKVV